MYSNQQGVINTDIQNSIVRVVETATRSLTLRDIVNATGIQVNTVRGSLTKLRKRGLVERGAFGWHRPTVCAAV